MDSDSRVKRSVRTAMRLCSWVPAFAGMTLMLATPARAIEIPWPTDAQPVTRIVIKHTPLTARLALGFDKALILNGAPAEKANLKAFPFIGKRTVRNPLIPGGEATFRGNIYDVAGAGLAATGVPTIWVDKPIAEDADGILSLLSLKADSIALVRQGGAGGHVYTLDRPGHGDALVKARAGGEEIRVGLDLRSPDKVMNARAAAALEAAGVVKRSGKVGLWSPFPGVALPFERLTPVPNARLLGLPLVRPAARISEARAKTLDAAAKAGTSTVADDDDTITVIGTRKRKGPDPWLLIGRDVLDQCSRIEFDRPGKRWLLTCSF